MQRLTNHLTRTQPSSRRREDSPATLTAKLEIARRELGRAFLDVQAAEGRLLDYEAAEAISRALITAARNLQELTVSIAVLERRVPVVRR
jgi:hypothetical protein